MVKVGHLRPALPESFPPCSQWSGPLQSILLLSSLTLAETKTTAANTEINVKRTAAAVAMAVIAKTRRLACT